MFLAVEMTNGSFNRRERLNVAFSHANLFVDTNSIKPKNLAPLRSTSPNTVYLNKDVSSGIAHLLRCGRPMAVSWRIISIDIFPINRMFGRRFFAHIGKKVFETVAPVVTNHNATTTIGVISRVVRVVAAKFHLGPSLILRSASQAMRSGILIAAKQFGCRFLCQTAATKRSAANVRSGCNRGVSAVALALPHGVLCAWNFYLFNDQQTSEFLSLNVSHTLSPKLQDIIGNWGLKIKREMP